MKPFYVDVSIYEDDEERRKIEKEIFDIAIANGAEIYEARDWWTSKAMINTSADWHYFGVDDAGRTCFNNHTNYYGEAVQLTIEQLREKYPMKKEQDDVRTWGCFQQVANVIGEEAAVRELSLITDDMRIKGQNKERDLLCNFEWGFTPQGEAFWNDIDNGEVPHPYKIIVKQHQNQHKDESNTNTPPEKENVSKVDLVIENVMKNTVVDMVKEPPHYLLFPEYNLEVKEINKRLLDRMETSTMDVTLYEAGWYQQAMQYLMRCYAKNQWEDIEKAHETLGFMLQSRKERIR